MGNMHRKSTGFCHRSIGSVIVTKLDGHAKGGGALSAVAATGAPIRFLGTGEHFDNFQPFEADSFVSKLLGRGDLKGLMSTFSEVMPSEQQQMQMVERMSQGHFSLRDLYEQLKNMTKMGSLSNLMSMVPGMSGMSEMMGAGGEEEAQKRVKRFLTMMDSMSAAELDGKGDRIEKAPSRILRIARGAGVHPGFVGELLAEHKRFEKMIGKMGKTGLLSKDPKQLMRNPADAMKKLQGAMDPQILKKMGGAGGMMDMMKQLEGMDMSQMGGMQEMMQGMMGKMGGGKGAGKGGKNALAAMLGKGGGGGRR
eukprot:g7139.t1